MTVPNYPSNDAWIALRLAGQDKGVAGFLVPLDVDRTDSDWIFRCGVYCRNMWDINRTVLTHVEGKAVVTSGATSFVPRGCQIFREYSTSVETMLSSLTGQEPPPLADVNEIWAEGDLGFLQKLRGQKLTTASLVFPNSNSLFAGDDVFAMATYVPDTANIHKYCPVGRIRLGASTTQNARNVDAYDWTTLLTGYSASEMEALNKDVVAHGGKPVIQPVRED